MSEAMWLDSFPDSISYRRFLKSHGRFGRVRKRWSVIRLLSPTAESEQTLGLTGAGGHGKGGSAP